MVVTEEQLEVEADAIGGMWWIFLVTGIIWLLYSWVVLSLGHRTVLAIAILAGCGFIGVGLNEFLIAGVAAHWRWLHVVGGLLCVAAGIVAFAWPNETNIVLAGILGWFLLFRGVFDIINAFAIRESYDLWWFTLIAGAAELGIGFWAVGYPGHSLLLLAYWVGFFALFRGVTEIMLAFKLRSALHGS